MVFFNNSDISNLEHLYRINLINSISGFKSANLISTKGKDGIENVAVFSSVIHLGSNPALFGFIVRPTTVPRNTYQNIIDTGYYTINHIHQNIIEDAHHTSAKYDKSISEYSKTKLEAEYLNNFKAPYVKSAPVKIGLKFKEALPILANDTILIIGEVENLHIDEDLLNLDGFVNLTKGAVACINGLDTYTVPETYRRLTYQRPKI